MKQLLLLLLGLCLVEASAAQVVQKSSEQSAMDKEITGSDGTSQVRLIGYQAAWEISVASQKRRVCEYNYQLVNTTENTLKLNARELFEEMMPIGGGSNGGAYRNWLHRSIKAGMWAADYERPPVTKTWKEPEYGLYPATPQPIVKYFTYEAFGLAYEKTGEPEEHPTDDCPPLDEVFKIQDIVPYALMFQLSFAAPGKGPDKEEKKPCDKDHLDNCARIAVSEAVYPVLPTQEFKEYSVEEWSTLFDPNQIPIDHEECKRATDGKNGTKPRCLYSYTHYKKTASSIYITESGELVRGVWTVEFREDNENMGTLLAPGTRLYQKEEGQYKDAVEMYNGSTYKPSTSDFDYFIELFDGESREKVESVEKRMDLSAFVKEGHLYLDK